MSKMKKITAALLAAALLSGCGAEVPAAPSEMSSQPAQQSAPQETPAPAASESAPESEAEQVPAKPIGTEYTLHPEDVGRVPAVSEEGLVFCKGVSEVDNIAPYAMGRVRQGSRRWFVEADQDGKQMGICRKDPDADWVWVGSIRLEPMDFGGSRISLSFWNEEEGALLLYHAGGIITCYTTQNGGESWVEMDEAVWPATPMLDVSGMGFTGPHFGAVCWAYENEPQPQIEVTRDGGRSWQPLDLTVPDLEGYSQSGSPFVENGVIVLPIYQMDDGRETLRYFLSEDEGLTWKEEELDGSCPLSLSGWETIQVENEDAEPGSDWFEAPFTEPVRAKLETLLNTGDWRRIPPPEYCTSQIFMLENAEGESLGIHALKDELMAAVQTKEMGNPECWAFSGDIDALEALAADAIKG